MSQSQGNALEPIRVQIIKESSLYLEEVELECAVGHIGDNKPIRLLSQRKIGSALGMTGNAPAPIVQLVTNYESLKNYVSPSLKRYSQVYIWKTATGMNAKGYRAEILPELCDLYLCARDAGVLTPLQSQMAERCYRLMRAFAKIAIVAMVDEATGYQEIRAKDDLRLLLEYYLADTPFDIERVLFGEKFWRGAFSLYGYEYHPKHRPQCLKSFISKAVYAYCPRPVYDKVKEQNPIIDEKGRREHIHHHYFQQDAWERQLKTQVGNVMCAGNNLYWQASRREEFWHSLARMCRQSNVIEVGWRQATEDRGIEGLPLFGYTQEYL